VNFHAKRDLKLSACRWSSKCGEYPAGEPDLHHVAGSLYAEEHGPYDAERHLALGTKDSVDLMAKLEYEWYSEDDPHTAALYAARAVFPYLLLGNIRDASKVLSLFISRLSESKNLAVQDVSVGGTDMRLYPSLPLLNFLGLLLLAVQKGGADLYRQLKSHYAIHIKEVGKWDEALESIAEMYFGISPPRQSNPLLDMMGSMFGGGAAPKKQQSKRVTPTTSTPVAEGLD
jgi:golgi to ER traffic protein 4